MVAAVFTALGVGAPEARAESRDPAAAQALFDQARQLMRAGKFGEACPKFEESNRLDPGIGTQFNLADCYEHSGRVASAWALFLEVASQAQAAGQMDRQKAAEKRAAKLEARLPRLEIEVPDASRVEGLEIRRDGVLMGSAQWGTPMPVDPGEHEIVASAPQHQTLTQTLRMEEGKTASFELPALAAASNPPAQQALVAEGSSPAAPPTSEPGPASSDEKPAAEASSGPNFLFLGLAGVAVVGLGVGTSFALMASSKNEDSKKECRSSNSNLCSSDGVTLRNEARSQGNIATVGFVVGGAALAGAAAVLLFDRPSKEEQTHATLRLAPRAAIATNGAALGVAGSF